MCIGFTSISCEGCSFYSRLVPDVEFQEVYVIVDVWTIDDPEVIEHDIILDVNTQQCEAHLVTTFIYTEYSSLVLGYSDRVVLYIVFGEFLLEISMGRLGVLSIEQQSMSGWRLFWIVYCKMMKHPNRPVITVRFVCGKSFRAAFTWRTFSTPFAFCASTSLLPRSTLLL